MNNNLQQVIFMTEWETTSNAERQQASLHQPKQEDSKARCKQYSWDNTHKQQAMAAAWQQCSKQAIFMAAMQQAIFMQGYSKAQAASTLQQARSNIHADLQRGWETEAARSSGKEEERERQHGPVPAAAATQMQPPAAAS
jgi:hypothetical protein